MGFPKLVPSSLCKTDITIALYTDGLTQDGSPSVALSMSLKCNYQDSAKVVLTDEKKEIQLTGIAYFDGDIAPNMADISNGKAVIFGESRRIVKGTKARNPNGTVNYTKLELV